MKVGVCSFPSLQSYVHLSDVTLACADEQIEAHKKFRSDVLRVETASTHFMGPHNFIYIGRSKSIILFIVTTVKVSRSL